MSKIEIHEPREIRWREVAALTFIIFGQCLWYFLHDSPLFGAIPILLGLFMLWKNRDPIPVRYRIDSHEVISPKWIWLALSLLCCGAAGFFDVGTLGRLGLWFLGIGVLVSSIWQSPKPQIPSDEVTLILMITLIGLLIRVIGIGTFPQTFFEDEGYFSLQATQAIPNPFAISFDGHPMLYHVLQGIFIDLLGRNYTAPRLLSALLGTLAIPGVYLAGKRLFDPRIGLLAALLMMSFPQHVHFSRLALNQAFDPTVAVWMIVFLAGERNRANLVLAGLMLGLSQYGYSAARLIPMVAVVFIVFETSSEGKINFLQTIPKYWLVFVVAGIVFLPQGIYLIQNSESVSPRLGQTAIWSDRGSDYLFLGRVEAPPINWVHQVTAPFLGFLQMPDATIFYRGSQPFLGWFAPIPFLLGVSLKNRRVGFLGIWWILTAIFGGILLTNPPQFQRFVIATPALVILVALGVVYLSDLLVWVSNTLTPQQPVPMVAAYLGIPIILVSGLVALDTKAYFLDYRTRDITIGRLENLNAIAENGFA